MDLIELFPKDWHEQMAEHEYIPILRKIDEQLQGLSNEEVLCPNYDLIFSAFN